MGGGIMEEIIITSSVLIIMIFILRRLTMGKISMRLRYALWLLVAVRLVLPVSVGNSPISVMNLMPDGQSRTETAAYAAADSQGNPKKADASKGVDVPNGGGVRKAETSVIDEAGTPMPQNDFSKDLQHQDSSIIDSLLAGEKNTPKSGEITKTKDLGSILRCIWLVGMLSVAGYMSFHQIRFICYLRRNRKEIAYEKLPKGWKERLRKRGISVYRVKSLPSPCLVGKSIYIGPDTMEDKDRFAHILAHEYSHAGQYDTVWALLRSMLAALYWFHPLVWAAAYAAKQDSELSCDEAAIRLLGEETRFSYGRTLLHLLSGGQGRGGCVGVVMTMDDRESRVRQRVLMIAHKPGNKKSTVAIVLVLTALACGCAFTGADTDTSEVFSQTGSEENGGTSSDAESEGNDGTPDAKQEEYEAKEEALEQQLRELEEEQAALQEQLENEAKQAAEAQKKQEAFETMLYGMDDTQLAAEKTVDMQAYYQYYNYHEGENPLQDGQWYLLHKDAESGIAFYGLYTSEYGLRGLKTLIDGDVNTFDEQWTPCEQWALSSVADNVKVLEYAEDGNPRSFVFKMCMENTSDKELWKLYVADRYDTGHIDLYSITSEECLEQIKNRAKLSVSEDESDVLVTFDGDMAIWAVDIDIADLKRDEYTVEKAVWDENVIGYRFGNGAAAGAGFAQEETDVTLLAAIGIKIAESDTIWYSGLNLIEFPLDIGEFADREFTLGAPKVNTGLVNSVKQTIELKPGEGADISGEPDNTLAVPLSYEGIVHYVGILYSNPCPSYNRVSDPYGDRIHPLTGKTISHYGIDLAAEEGSDIVAAADGTVYKVSFDTYNGNYIVLVHENGEMTYYLHCKEITAKEGDRVTRGAQIATVGKTGRATGPVLHFALSYKGQWEEPVFAEGEIDYFRLK